MYEDHFLDANIMVVSKIEWDDRHDNIGKYMSKENIRRHTSKRAFEESNKVFERIRRTISQYVDGLDRKFGKSKKLYFIDERTEPKIKKFNEKFLSCLDEKERKILTLFMSQYSTEINNIVVLGSEKDILTFKRKIRKDITTVIYSLAADCRPDTKALILRHDNCPWIYNSCYIDEYSELIEIVDCEEDIHILLDSYFIKDNNIGKELFFVTLDRGHILNNKEEIELILDGIFCVSPYR